MTDSLTIEKGADRVVEVTIFASNGHGAPIAVKTTASALATATSLSIELLEDALANGDMLMAPGNQVITINGAHAVWATTLTVLSLPGNAKSGMTFRKLQDLGGYTIKLEVLSNSGDATPVIADTVLAVALSTQSAITGRGRVQVTFEAADTSSITAGSYTGKLWRRDTANNRLLWSGDVHIVEQGFL